MAYFNIPENPKFSENIRKFETTDPGHADLFNSVIQALLHNDIFIKKLTEQLFATAVANSESYSNEVYQQATGYTDRKVADLINGETSTLETIEQIAKAMEDNADVVTALNESIGKKADQAELDGHLAQVNKMLGSASISNIGDGTITGALVSLNTDLGGFRFYPGKMTQAQYDTLPEETKATQGLIFVIEKE